MKIDMCIDEASNSRKSSELRREVDMGIAKYKCRIVNAPCDPMAEYMSQKGQGK